MAQSVFANEEGIIDWLCDTNPGGYGANILSEVSSQREALETARALFSKCVDLDRNSWLKVDVEFWDNGIRRNRITALELGWRELGPGWPYRGTLRTWLERKQR